MAFDGITMNALMQELKTVLLGQRISKIAQPEKEELLLTFKGVSGANRLLISANATLPFLYLTQQNKTSPMTAPNFCMLLRKYISNGRITDITQPSLERVLCFRIEHLDELGDESIKYLYVEIMGKHSNIIFCNADNIIIDSIKHISSQLSSVREVLPGRTYFIPTQEQKKNPWQIDQEGFLRHVCQRPTSIAKGLYTSLIGISPVMAQEIAARCGFDGDSSMASLDTDNQVRLYLAFSELMHSLTSSILHPVIYFNKENCIPIEFSVLPLTIYQTYPADTYSSLSQLLQDYYAKRNQHTNMRQKSTDLRKIISIHLERSRKKYQLQKKQLEDTQKKDIFRIYGELLHTYGYQISENKKKITVPNYYTNEDITIPLDENLSPMENAQKYFDKYAKLKRTAEALSQYISETQNRIQHLESIAAALDIAENDADLSAIKEELSDYGFIKKHAGKKKNSSKKSTPLHFVDPNGYHIYVGKNNYQNDTLTLKFASGNDWWFHTKEIPGSHVIVKSQGHDLPDTTFEYAASIAAYYSAARDNNKVEIDYLQKKNIKKPNGSAPGFVIYHTNYSMVVTPSLNGLKPLE